MNPYIPFVCDRPHALVTYQGILSDKQLAAKALKRGDTKIVNGQKVGDWYKHGDLKLAARWLKDDKTVLLYTDCGLADMGLAVDSSSGIIKTSKRLSRVFRPSRFFSSYSRDEEPVVYEDPRLDPALWDGMALIGRDLVNDVAQRSPYMLALREADPERHYDLLQDALACDRVEITVLTDRGQIKGHALVVDGCDVTIARSAFKPEIRTTDGSVFVAIEPVHGSDDARTDIQSLVNLHPFIEPFFAPAIAALRAENATMLAQLADGTYRFPKISLSDLADSEEQFPLMLINRFGLDPRSYPTVANMVVRSRLSQLASMWRQFHLHLPGLRRRYLSVYHLAGTRSGVWSLDATSLGVSPADYGQIAGVLGGADLDDGLMVLPFLDYDGRTRVLVWRQPNQAGEYWLLDTDGAQFAGDELVTADSRHLPTRIDLQEDRPGPVAPSEPPMTWADAVERLQGNAGAIGTFANYMMMFKSATGEMPKLPCSFESVIDSAVKDGRSVAAELGIVRTAMLDLCLSTPLPKAMLPRVPDEAADDVRIATDHWLDRLQTETGQVYLELDERRQALKMSASLPIAELLAAGDLDRGGKAYRWFFELPERFTRKVVQEDGKIVDEPDWPTIGRMFAAQLKALETESGEAEVDRVILGILAYAGLRGTSDLPVFMSATARRCFEAMERHGVVSGTQQSVAIYVMHTWYNRLRARGDIRKMCQIPTKERKAAKAEQAPVWTAIRIEGRNVYVGPHLAGMLPKDEDVLGDGVYAVLGQMQDMAEGAMHLRVTVQVA